jgi:hypothetical protein
MPTLFSRRAAGLASITASALILLYQFAQIILVLTVDGSRRNQVRHRPGSKATTNSKRLGVSPLLVKAAGWLAAIGHGSR